MVELCVPIVSRCVVTAERKLEVVIVIIANDGSLDIDAIGRGLGGKTNFTEIGDLAG